MEKIPHTSYVSILVNLKFGGFCIDCSMILQPIQKPPNASIGRNYRPIRVSVSVVHYYCKGWCVRVRTRAICGRTCVGVCVTILKNDNYSSSSELGIFMH